MSPVKQICVFEHSVMTHFNCACPAIQRGQRSGFLSERSSWLTACMSEQRKFWRDCANAQARLNLRCSHRRLSTKFAWRGPYESHFLIYSSCAYEPFTVHVRMNCVANLKVCLNFVNIHWCASEQVIVQYTVHDIFIKIHWFVNFCQTILHSVQFPVLKPHFCATYSCVPIFFYR